MTRFPSAFLRNGLYWFPLCMALLVAIAVLDHAVELSVSILCLAPVLITAWFFGGRAGVLVSVVAAVIWFVFDALSDLVGTNVPYRAWDAAVQFAAFAIFAVVIAKLKSALSHADERFATVLEGLDVMVYVADAESGDLLYANGPFRKAFPDGRAPPALPPGQNEGEVREAATGRWFLMQARPLRWIDGRIARLSIATDITERRRAEELHLQQQEKLALNARLVAVGEMATTLAHELNQPLAAIANYNMGCVQRLRSGDWQTAELLEAMEKGALQAERASEVIRRLREFVARRAPRLAACDINEVVRDVRATIEAEAGKHSVRLALALSERVSYVRADQTLMEQVILNLARNAIEAMADAPPGERELRILSRTGPGETVEVEVADRGPGIDPEIETRLFSPFLSTKPDGMGLGLHISRSIVEAHGGHLWVTRNGGRGASFHFSLRSVYA